MTFRQFASLLAAFVAGFVVCHFTQPPPPPPPEPAVEYRVPGHVAVYKAANDSKNVVNLEAYSEVKQGFPARTFGTPPADESGIWVVSFDRGKLLLFCSAADG